MADKSYYDDERVSAELADFASGTLSERDFDLYNNIWGRGKYYRNSYSDEEVERWEKFKAANPEFVEQVGNEKVARYAYSELSRRHRYISDPESGGPQAPGLATQAETGVNPPSPVDQFPLPGLKAADQAAPAAEPTPDTSPSVTPPTPTKAPEEMAPAAASRPSAQPAAPAAAVEGPVYGEHVKPDGTQVNEDPNKWDFIAEPELLMNFDAEEIAEIDKDGRDFDRALSSLGEQGDTVRAKLEATLNSKMPWYQKVALAAWAFTNPQMAMAEWNREQGERGQAMQGLLQLDRQDKQVEIARAQIAAQNERMQETAERQVRRDNSMRLRMMQNQAAQAGVYNFPPFEGDLLDDDAVEEYLGNLGQRAASRQRELDEQKIRQKDLQELGKIFRAGNFRSLEEGRSAAIATLQELHGLSREEAEERFSGYANALAAQADLNNRKLRVQENKLAETRRLYTSLVNRNDKYVDKITADLEAKDYSQANTTLKAAENNLKELRSLKARLDEEHRSYLYAGELEDPALIQSVNNLGAQIAELDEEIGGAEARVEEARNEMRTAQQRLTTMATTYHSTLDTTIRRVAEEAGVSPEDVTTQVVAPGTFGEFPLKGKVWMAVYYRMREQYGDLLTPNEIVAALETLSAQAADATGITLGEFGAITPGGERALIESGGQPLPKRPVPTVEDDPGLIRALYNRMTGGKTLDEVVFPNAE